MTKHTYAPPGQQAGCPPVPRLRPGALQPDEVGYKKAGEVWIYCRLCGKARKARPAMFDERFYCCDCRACDGAVSLVAKRSVPDDDGKIFRERPVPSVDGAAWDRLWRRMEEQDMAKKVEKAEKEQGKKRKFTAAAAAPAGASKPAKEKGLPRPGSQWMQVYEICLEVMKQKGTKKDVLAAMKAKGCKATLSKMFKAYPHLTVLA